MQRSSDRGYQGILALLLEPSACHYGKLPCIVGYELDGAEGEIRHELSAGARKSS